jgi:hypothetical protein
MEEKFNMYPIRMPVLFFNYFRINRFTSCRREAISVRPAPFAALQRLNAFCSRSLQKCYIQSHLTRSRINLKRSYVSCLVLFMQPDRIQTQSHAFPIRPRNVWRPTNLATSEQGNKALHETSLL